MNEIDGSTVLKSEIQLKPTQSAPSDARRFIEEVLDDHASVEAAKLIVSELVTNAVLHGGRDAGEVTVVVGRERDRRIRLEVSQSENRGFHFLDQEPGHLGPTGRGLMIVEAVASEWGVDRGTGSVWAIVG